MDAPKAIQEYMPGPLLQDAIFLTQYMDIHLDGEEQYRLSKERYDLLRDTARLVITSRYHIATPCHAMGIPVIMLENCAEDHHWTFDPRFPAMNPGIPFYTKEQWGEIDWNPKPMDFEVWKSEITNLIIHRIETAVHIAEMKEKTENFLLPNKKRFWETFRKNRHKIDIFGFNAYLNRRFLSRTSGAFKYYLYGLSDRYVKEERCIFLEYIERHYPEARFLGFVDGKKTGSFMGKDIVPPDAMKMDDQTYCVVSAYTANEYVSELFEKRGWDKSHLWLMPKEILFFVYHL